MTDSGCVPISDDCSTFDVNGQCTSCFKGYDVREGACIFSEFNNQVPFDLGCKTWDWDNQICLECSFRWVQSDGRCLKVSDGC